jgi:RNA polymerase sigma-70 factor (ECF subfamily)
MSSSQAASPEFQTTHWSLVVAAAEQGNETAKLALADLCQAYWYPLYAFLRRRGESVDDSADLTQAFFATLLEKGYLADADPQRGRFRSFLLTAISRFASKEHDRAAAQKRGGGTTTLSLDFQDGERRYQREPADNWTPERVFERRWALTLLDRTLSRLRQDHEAAGKLTFFEAFKGFLTADCFPGPLRQIGEQLGITEGAAKVAVHRLRQKYRELLRAEIAQTLDAAEDVENELGLLLSALRGD